MIGDRTGGLPENGIIGNFNQTTVRLTKVGSVWSTGTPGCTPEKLEPSLHHPPHSGAAQPSSAVASCRSPHAPPFPTQCGDPPASPRRPLGKGGTPANGDADLTPSAKSQSGFLCCRQFSAVQILESDYRTFPKPPRRKSGYAQETDSDESLHIQRVLHHLLRGFLSEQRLNK